MGAVSTGSTRPSENVPPSEFGNYRFTFLSGAPLTKAAYMAELIDRARIDHKTDTYIHGYPFFWDRDLADAAQLKAEQYVYSRTGEKQVPTAWYSVLPQKYQVQNLVEIDVNGGGNPEEIVGYWTAYWEPHIEKKKIEYEDEWGEKQTREETVMVEGRYIHPSADMNKIFNHESRYIGVGHVASDLYNLRDYWVVLLAK